MQKHWFTVLALTSILIISGCVGQSAPEKTADSCPNFLPDYSGAVYKAVDKYGIESLSIQIESHKELNGFKSQWFSNVEKFKYAKINSKSLKNTATGDYIEYTGSLSRPLEYYKKEGDDFTQLSVSLSFDFKDATMIELDSRPEDFSSLSYESFYKIENAKLTSMICKTK